MDYRESYLKQLEEKWEHLTITNDIMFGMVMENEQICLELIQRSLPELNIKAISRITPRNKLPVQSVHERSGLMFLSVMKSSELSWLKCKLRISTIFPFGFVITNSKLISIF